MKPLSQDHKDLGVVYTPDILVQYICRTAIHEYIIEYMIRKNNIKLIVQNGQLKLENLSKEIQTTILNLIEQLTILDPAVGTGYFLQSAFEILFEIHQNLVNLGIQQKSFDQIREEIVSKNLYGVDISKRAVKLCQERLFAVIGIKELRIPEKNLETMLKHHIRVGNSLIGNTFSRENKVSITDLPYFNWDQEFPDIAQNGGFSICVGNPPWNVLKPLEKEFFSKFDPQLSKYKLDKQKARKIINQLKKDQTKFDEWGIYETTIKKQSDYYRKTYHYQSGIIQTGSKSKRISGDINLYKLFLERIFVLLADNGACGIIVPSGIHSDAGTKGLRRLLFEENTVRRLYSFENRLGIFPFIHKSFKFDLLFFLKNRNKTDEFQTSFMQKTPEILNDKQHGSLTISWERIKRFSPSAWSIIEFKNEYDLQIAGKMYQYPVLSEEVPNFTKISFSRELDVTIDSHLFNSGGNGFPVFEGKMIEQFNHQFKKPRYWIDQNSINFKFDTEYSEYKHVRIGFRAVAASTNRRTMIATLIPVNSCCSNSIIFVKNYSKSNQLQMRQEELLYILGVFNSFVFDYLLRLKVSQNLNMFIIRDMPLPRFMERKWEQEIINLVKVLYANIPLFDIKVGQNEQKYLHYSYNEKLALIDALVAHSYRLSYSELEYILDQFHIHDKQKEMALDEQRKKILSFFNKVEEPNISKKLQF